MTTRACLLFIAAVVGVAGRPTLNCQEPMVHIFGSIREGKSMQWGAPPPGSAHAPRVRSFDLQHQIVRIAFDWSRHAVTGSTTLRLAALERPLDRVQLDAVGMTIKAVRTASGTSLPHDYDGRLITVRLPAPLRARDSTSITIDYESVRPKAGVYFVDRRHVVWTQGRFEDNRYWVPTYDFPNDKTTWEFFVRSAANERAFAGGSLAGQRPVDGGIEWHWVQDAPAPTYMMTVAVGPYATADAAVGQIRLHYWSYADSIEAARSGFASTPKIIDLLARRLGTPFPSSSFDQIVVPDFIFWDGLESWRPIIPATVHDEQLILAGQTGWPGEEATMAIARAVAQQWFGKLVTPANWSHIWLSDGIANFLAQVYIEETEPVGSARNLNQWSHVSAFAADRDARRPLVYDRWQYGPMELLLTEHVAQKGAVVLHMLRRDIGDNAFWSGLRRFLADHANATVTTADLQRAMEQSSSRSLDTFFRQWVYGAGLPFLRVSFQFDSSSKRITFTAEQNQQRDEMTGFFDATVDVQLLTDAGALRGRVPIHGERSTFTMPLASAPRAIRWDPDGILLSEVEFPRPTEMFLYQLEHDADAAGRAEAAQELGQRATGMEGQGMMVFSAGNMPSLAHPEIADALLRAARTDTSLLVREHAMQSMAFLRMFRPDITKALLELTRDHNPSIRGIALAGLIGPPDDEVTTRISEMAKTDPDSSVRTLAVQRLGMFASVDGYALVKERFERATSEIEKAGFVMMLASSEIPGGWNLAKKYLSDPASSRPVREAAMRALGIGVFMSQVRQGPDPRELVTLLAPFLDSDDPSLRLAAAREMGQAKIPAARAALEARKNVEVDARVLREIDDAIAESARERPGPGRVRDEE